MSAEPVPESPSSRGEDDLEDSVSYSPEEDLAARIFMDAVTRAVANDLLPLGGQPHTIDTEVVTLEDMKEVGAVMLDCDWAGREGLWDGAVAVFSADTAWHFCQLRTLSTGQSNLANGFSNRPELEKLEPWYGMTPEIYEALTEVILLEKMSNQEALEEAMPILRQQLALAVEQQGLWDLVEAVYRTLTTDDFGQAFRVPWESD